MEYKNYIAYRGLCSIVIAVMSCLARKYPTLNE